MTYGESIQRPNEYTHRASQGAGGENVGESDSLREPDSLRPSLEAMLQIVTGLEGFADSVLDGDAEAAEFRRGLAICEKALKAMAQRA